MGGKTGGWGGLWVVLEKPKPPRVDDVELYWAEGGPAVLSARCAYWVRQIQAGWRPSRRIGGEGYYGSAEWYGIYIGEYVTVIQPLLSRLWSERVEGSAGAGVRVPDRISNPLGGSSCA